MTEQHATRFAAWLAVDPQTRSISGIAKKLSAQVGREVSRQRVTHWRNGRSEPELSLLVLLVKLTGLQVEDFLVPDAIKALRRKEAA